ncbi:MULTISPECIES: pyruvate carboxylase [Niastella]|uniref:Pyruvate carboxylase n=1 Tax=Niastella soli TaxID=2821487 RepID=A0ABS3Z4A5_9BACT|nr:pyruvate carboxylase [Niastella soli]MBO9204868.1 pyruvate carboxylase [Niastella soli]
MFKKILVANRGEIAIRVLRAATELNIKTIAVYTFEDRYSLHRYKADEAYQIGKNDDPLKPYLDIEAIISVAKREKADAIHPGYGFLSENARFAQRCAEENIVFVGPTAHIMDQLGDKIAAKKVAKQAGVPMIEDSQADIQSKEIALQEAKRIGYPIIIKAAAGGGGRGMRVVRNEEDLEKTVLEARNEAKTAFGNDTVFFEKFIESPKHIEVQILGDHHGNIIHLFERDCSVQRRFQKVVEVAPAISLKQETRQKLHDYAIRICKQVGYNNAGTVEFLVDKGENIYFIEVNPRIQVEHTVTEEITGIDIVKSQLLVAQGVALTEAPINIVSQEQLQISGVAIQCRVTTEDPSNNFKPDFGTLIAYRNAGGPGIRLDEGSSYPGVSISPFFDSLLVKITASGRNLAETCDRLVRTLKEFRIRGVKTNIAFLENVLQNTTFQNGLATVDFIDNHPGLFHFEPRMDRGTKALQYLAEIIVNGHPDVPTVNPTVTFRTPVVPDAVTQNITKGSKDRLTEMGREKFIDWLKNNGRIQYTDTTFRDAHQSLLATRVRTTDMLKVAETVAKNHPEIFSLEMWGGATFDVALRFLHECPWQRLQLMRERIPNILFQMLIRGSNAVGYTAYPDNLVETFIEASWKKGIDIFRIFDSLNWLEGMQVSINAVRERTEGLAEACICYTGDFLDPQRNQKFNLQYYIDLAKRLEDAGAHILGIKDMAGLLKPMQAGILVSELKKSINIPIHLHTHDTSSIQSATYLKAIEAGVDVIDVALASMSGLTSQPNFNSIVAMMQGHAREMPMNLHKLNELSNYWEDVREYYYPFESQLKAGTAEVFDHEIPGGQYSNLRPQARSLGLENQFTDIKKNYVVVNKLFGDIVKVTPSSKVVGDMALFMTANDYTEQDIFDKGETISFPDSVIGLFRGDLGQTPGGFPQTLQKLILKNEKPFTDRPNAHLQPLDLVKEKSTFETKYGKQYSDLDLLSALFYPKVFDEYHQFKMSFGEVYYIPSPNFFYGLRPNEETLIELAPGKSILIKFLHMSQADENGYKQVFFKLNGQTRSIFIKDKSFTSVKPTHKKVSMPNEIGAPLQGKLSKILVKTGDAVQKNSPLFVIEAMKMESTIVAPSAAVVKNVVLNEGVFVEQDDVVVEL